MALRKPVGRGVGSFPYYHNSLFQVTAMGIGQPGLFDEQLADDIEKNHSQIMP
jgi:hypothetical protein